MKAIKVQKISNDIIITKQFAMNRDKDCTLCSCERCKLCWLFAKAIPDMKPCKECLDFDGKSIVI